MWFSLCKRHLASGTTLLHALSMPEDRLDLPWHHRLIIDLPSLTMATTQMN
ncbi:hypothetical protein ACFOGG_11190 [Brenneria rubrifaciens]|uniref:hypothetical protein n=1 Tax=Brenneria rubrifaciens TaxID=55213 RepID=UPI0036195125